MQSWLTACRALVRRPAFAATVVFTLALGIAATTTMFSVVDTVLLKPLPFPGADRLVSVMEANPAKSQKVSLIAPGRLEDWNRLARTFDAISASYAENVTDTSSAEPERLEGRRVSPRYFTVFGMTPLAGRTFAADEERSGGPPVAVISEGMWSRRYARAPRAIGQRLVLAGTGYTIVGVMPATFTGASIDVWLPAQPSPGMLRVREARFLTGVGRMKPGVSMAQASADLARVQQMLGEQYPASDKGWSASVADLKEQRVGSYRQALWLVFGAVALLLAIALANMAGLLLVQLHRRARELAVRRALGGSRAQIVGGVMREVLLLTAVGAAVGAVLSTALVRLFATTFATVPRMNEITVDARALAFSAAASAAAALVFGLWPALHATRGELHPTLAQGGRGSSAAGHQMQRGLVMAQIALSVVLAASAGLLLRSYSNLTRVDLGFNAEHVVSFHVGAAWDEDRVRVGQMQERIIAELEQLPDVVAAGITNFLPATGATLRYQVTVEGVAASDDNGKITVGERTVSAGYLRAMQVSLVNGAWCPPLRQDFKAPPKAVVNRAFTDRYGIDVIGRHFTFDQNPGTREIVGVVGNVAEDGQSATAAPYVYACESAGFWPDPEYIVRTHGDPRAVMSGVRALVHRIDPTRAIFGVKMVDALVAGALDQPRLNAVLLAGFAAAAIGLASLGVYSLLMLLVADRTREMGVRMALGAAPAQIVRLVVAGAGRLLAAGLAIGLILAAAAARALHAALFGVSPIDAPTLAAVAGVLTVVTLFAAAVPAWRAASIEPTDAMRSD